MSAPSTPAPSNLRQAHWGLLSQGLNTGTNFLLSLLVARAASPAEFGAFAVAMVLYMIGVGVVRASGNDVLAVAHARVVEQLPERAREVATYALGLGLVLGLGCAGVGLLLSNSALPFVVLGAALPLLLLQDALRGLVIAQGRPGEAALSDGTWALVQVVLVGVQAASAGGVSPTGAVVAWAAGGSAGAVLSLVRCRIRPAARWPHRWFWTHRDVAAPLLVSYVLTDLPINLTFLLMPLLADLAEVGVLRAAFLFFGPLGVLILCMRSMLLPDAARLDSPGSVRRLMGRATVALAAVATVWGAGIVLLPDVIGAWLLGETWDATFVPRLLLAVSLVAEAVMVGAVTTLSTLGLMRRMVQVQAVMAPATLVLVLASASVRGAAGAAGALALGYWVSALVAWLRVPSRLGTEQMQCPPSHRTKSGTA